MRLFKPFHTPTFVSVSIDDIDNAEADDSYTKVFVLTPTRTYIRHELSPFSVTNTNKNNSSVKWPSLKLRRPNVKKLHINDKLTRNTGNSSYNSPKRRSRWTFPSTKKVEHERNPSLPITYASGEISPTPRMTSSKAMNVSRQNSDISKISQSSSSKRPPFLEQTSESKLNSAINNVSHSKRPAEAKSVGYTDQMSQSKLISNEEPETESNGKTTFGNLYITLGASKELLPPIEPDIPLTERLEEEFQFEEEIETPEIERMHFNSNARFRNVDQLSTELYDDVRVFSKIYKKTDSSRRSTEERRAYHEKNTFSSTIPRSTYSRDSDYLALPPRSGERRLSRKDLYELEKTKSHEKSGEIVRQSIRTHQTNKSITSPLPLTPPELTHESDLSPQDPPDAVMKHITSSEKVPLHNEARHAKPDKSTYDWIDIASNIDTIQSSLNMCDQEYLTHQIEKMLTCSPHRHQTTSREEEQESQ